MQQEPFRGGLSGFAPDGRSSKSHKILLCTQQAVSIEAGRYRALFLLRQLKRLFLRESFLLTFLCRRWSFRSYFSRIRFGHWGDVCPFSACMFICWRQRFFGNDQVLHLNLSFDCSSFELSFHEPNPPVSRAGRHGDSAYAVVGALKCPSSWHHGQKQMVLFESWFVLAVSVSAI